MNILLLNHYAGSPSHGMEFRPYFMAREWVRLGHRVEIVACSYSHVRAMQPDVGTKVDKVEVIDGITYRWLHATAYRGNGVGRLLNIATFLARVLVRTGRFAREFQPDLVIASSTYPMDTWVVRHIARRAQCPWIYEVHDLWPQSLIELSGMSPLHPFALLCAWAERSAYRSADVVVSMLPKVQAHMAARGLDLRRLRIVPNGVALNECHTPAQALRDDLREALHQARLRGHQVVGYAGSMGLPNALDTLLDAAAMLHEKAVSFVLVGDGHEQERLRRRVQDERLTNVHFLAPIPKAQVPGFLQAIDVAYIGWQRVPLYRYGISPNKLMDYMMAGCLVLHSVEAGNDPVAEAGCGLTVPPEDPSAVAQGLQRLFELPDIQRRAMGDAGRRYVRSHHAYEVLAQRFLGVESTIP